MEATFNINTLLQGVAIALIVYGIKGIFSLDRKVSAQNGRLGKIETWLDGHEKQDDERHAEVISDINGVRNSVIKVFEGGIQIAKLKTGRKRK